MKARKKLKKPIHVAGLSDREVLIWLALSEQGEQSISALARFTGLHRPALYKSLPLLIEKGLVARELRGKRFVYISTGKKLFQQWQSIQQLEFQQKASELPEIVSLSQSMKDVTVYEDKDIRKVWEDVLSSKRGTVFYRYDAYSPQRVTMKKLHLPEDYYGKIERKGLERFVITNSSLRNGNFKRRFECEPRSFPKEFDLFEQGVVQFIYNDKIAFIDFNTKKAFIIRNEALARFHQKIFQFLLKSLKE